MAYGESEMVSIRGYRGFFPLALFGVFATVAAATRPSLPWVFANATEKTRFEGVHFVPCNTTCFLAYEESEMTLNVEPRITSWNHLRIIRRYQFFPFIEV